jgi:hypothetical protein
VKACTWQYVTGRGPCPLFLYYVCIQLQHLVKEIGDALQELLEAMKTSVRTERVTLTRGCNPFLYSQTAKMGRVVRANLEALHERGTTALRDGRAGL